MDEEAVLMRNQERVPPAAVAGGLARFPDPLAGLRVEAPKLAVAADSVKMGLGDERGAHDRVETVGLDLAVALAPPDDRRVLPVRGDLDHHRTVVERGHEQSISHLTRHRNREARPDLERDFPDRFPG